MHPKDEANRNSDSSATAKKPKHASRARQTDVEQLKNEAEEETVRPQQLWKNGKSQ